MDSPNNGFSNGPYNGNGNGNNNQNAPYYNTNQQQDITAGWVLNQLWYYKWSLLFFIVAFTIAAAIYAWQIQPVYQGSGTLIINSSKNQYSYSGSDISNLLTNSYGLGMGSSFDNQLAIIRSRKIAEETAEKVMNHPLMDDGQKHPILWQHYPEDSTTISQDQLVGRIRMKLQVSRAESNADLAKVTFESYSPDEAAAMVNLVIDTYTEVSTQKNRQAATSARKFLEDQRAKISEDLRQAEEELKNFQKQSGFVAAESQATSGFQKLSQLEEQKQQERIKLSSINTAIDNYEAQLKKIRPEFSKNFSDNVGPILGKLQDKLSELEAKRIVLISKNPELEDNPGKEPQLVTLNKQINSLKANIRQRANQVLAADTASSGFLTGQEETSRLMQLQQKMVQARVEKAQVKAQISVINELQNQQEATMDEVPEKTLRLARLKRRVDIQESMYKMISEQYAETSLWEQTQFGLGTPLNYATKPGQPIKPDFFSYILRGFLLGLFCGLGFVYLRKTMNTQIDSPERLTELPYPMLSVVPDFTKNSHYKEHEVSPGGSDRKYKISADWITFYNRNSSSAEAFRKLQNNILYSRPDEPMQTLMVTSAKQGEGKTSVTMNLATTLTEAGKKVLVIDCDLRRPNIHNMSGMNKNPGLMDVMFTEKQLNECIAPTPEENLFILPVGERPPNPSAILRSEKMGDILAVLRAHYDHILFDTPPLGIIGDAAPVVRHVEGVIVVSKFKYSDIKEVQKLTDELEHLQAPILGTVLTAFDPKKSADRYYHTADYYYNYQSYESYVDKES